MGIFAVASGSPLTPSGNHIHNARLTRNGNSWDLDPGITLWWPTSGGTLDFYAYYPYHEAATDPTAITFNVKADQSTAANHNHSHLLTAATSGYGKNQTVPLTFRHALTMIQVSIPGGKGWGDERFSVTLRNVKSGATLNLNNINNTPGNEITLDDDNNPEHITMYRLAEATAGNYIFRALVPAQTIAQGSNLFLFDCAGQALLRDEALTEALTMTAGQADKFTRKIPYPMIETVTIPAGTFLMGSPDTEPDRRNNETQHEVTLTQDFRMSKYEITNAQYVAFLNAAGVGSDGSRLTIQNGQKLINKHPCSVTYNDNETSWVFQSGTEDHPISYVSWYGAKAYTEWVSQTTRTDCRLPTEAQWEYACRAGT
ncbi:MAG: fimbrillin family protein, partial [Tannerellaceae bacterium]|nr:fimbrillin family protein [Tannerellaceae bacterium]